LDIEEFFPSITARDIDHFLEAPDAPQSDWSSEDRALFIDTVCRFERLTIGAPSSPGLSNALCFELDLQLSQLADRLGLTYTRYADDMFFSTGEKNVLREVEQEVAATLSALDCPGELKLRTGKTRHSSKRGRRQVTGLVLGSDGRVHLGRSRKRFIRREIHRWEKLSDEQKRELAGMLAFAMSIESNFMNALILKYGPKRIAEVRAAL
jgi:RNA-directed DNA polymerase